jgi:hypothetical protein
MIWGTGWPGAILSGAAEVPGPSISPRSWTSAKVAMTAAASPTRMSRRCRSSWSVAGLPYLTVSVPVIRSIAWNEQMKTYVPASMGWYW